MAASAYAVDAARAAETTLAAMMAKPLDFLMASEDDLAAMKARLEAAKTAERTEAEAAASESSSLDPQSDVPITLDTLPDDATRAIFYKIRSNAIELRHAFRLFAVSKRLRASAAAVVDELDLDSSTSSAEAEDMLKLPYTQAGPYDLYYRGEASLLAPHGWARTLAGLRVLRIGHLSWGGAARLLTLLPAWPCLEHLELRFAYDHRLPDFHLRSLTNNSTPFQDFAADLSAFLSLGFLPKLRFMWMGNIARTHCIGQRLSTRDADGSCSSPYGSARAATGTSTSIELDDRQVSPATLSHRLQP